MDLFAFAFICLVWGSSFIATERASHALGPVGIGVWRPLLAYTLTVAVPYLIQPYVLEQGFGHSFFSAMVALIPLMTVAASVPILGVRPSGREIVGVLGGLAFIVVLLMDGFDRGMSLTL